MVCPSKRRAGLMNFETFGQLGASGSPSVSSRSSQKECQLWVRPFSHFIQAAEPRSNGQIGQIDGQAAAILRSACFKI
jgi:hypothetical protein